MREEKKDERGGVEERFKLLKVLSKIRKKDRFKIIGRKKIIFIG